MNYKLNIENNTHHVEEIRLPTAATLAHAPKGKPFSFVTTFRLPFGETCFLVGDTGGYELEVHSCFAFAYSGKFLVSGIIIAKHDKAEFKSDDSFHTLPDLQPA